MNTSQAHDTEKTTEIESDERHITATVTGENCRD